MANTITENQLKELAEDLRGMFDLLLEDVMYNCNTIEDVENYNCKVTDEMILTILDACNITQIEVSVIKHIDNIIIDNLIK